MAAKRPLQMFIFCHTAVSNCERRLAAIFGQDAIRQFNAVPDAHLSHPGRCWLAMASDLLGSLSVRICPKLSESSMARLKGKSLVGRVHDESRPMTTTTHSPTPVRHRAVRVSAWACRNRRAVSASSRSRVRRSRMHRHQAAVAHLPATPSEPAPPAPATPAIWGMPEPAIPEGADGVTFSFEGVTPRRKGGGGGESGVELLSSAAFFGIGVFVLFLLLLAGSQVQFTPREPTAPVSTDSSTIWRPGESTVDGTP